jgi:nicotinate phosphoribosyltransferase
LVEIRNKPCIKLSEEIKKITFPGKKNVYRMFDSNNRPLVDVITNANEPEPVVNEPFLCRHPFTETKRAFVSPKRIEKLLVPVWENGQLVDQQFLSYTKIREHVKDQLLNFRQDHKRFLNPTPYKVSFYIYIYIF